MRGNVVVLHALLERMTCDTRLKDNHFRTALHLAARHGYIDAEQALLAHPTCITSVKDSWSNTVADHATNLG